MVNYSFPLYITPTEVTADEQRLLSDVEEGPLMDRVNYIIIHCSATPPSCNYTVDRLLRDHRKRGFRTVGYHFYIRRDGTVTQHRQIMAVGAHCRPWNRCSVGVCYEGGVDAGGHPADTRTAAQRRAMLHLVLKLHQLFPKALIRGHRDMPGTQPKACPSFDVEETFGFLMK